MGQHQFCSGFITGGWGREGEPHFCNGLNDLTQEEAGGGGGGGKQPQLCNGFNTEVVGEGGGYLSSVMDLIRGRVKGGNSSSEFIKKPLGNRPSPPFPATVQ